MTDLTFTRRDLLAAGTGVASCLPFTSPGFALGDALLRRAIPHGNGETLPVVGVGTSQVFDVGDDATKRKALDQVLSTLAAAGGSLIDTASSYGTSEEVVGALVAGTHLRESLFIATKLEARGDKEAAAEAAFDSMLRWESTTPFGLPSDPEVKSTAAFATSLKRLRVERVDLLQLHNVEDDDPGLGFYRDLKAAGKVRYVGATTTFKDAYGAMEKLIRTDKPDFIQIDCSIANRGAEERIIPAAAEVGAAVLIALPFGRASLFGKVEGKPLPPVAQEIGATSWGQVFLKYVLGNPAVTAVIPGTGDPKHLADNLAAGRGALPDAKQRAALVSYFEGLG